MQASKNSKGKAKCEERNSERETRNDKEKTKRVEKRIIVKKVKQGMGRKIQKIRDEQ